MIKSFKKFLSPTVTTVIRTFHPPAEIMRRLSKGIESQGQGRTRKPFEGEIEKMSFRLETKYFGKDTSLQTRGTVTENSGGNRITLVTEFGPWEVGLTWTAVLAAFLFYLYQDLKKGALDAGLYLGALGGWAVLWWVFGAGMIKVHARQHLQFIRTALETERGFDLAEHKRVKWKDVLALGAVALACIAVVVIVTVKYILPLADGGK